MKHSYTAEIYQDGDWYVSHCPELGIGIQGQTVNEAWAMLIEAVELTLEGMDEEQYRARLNGDYFVDSAISEQEMFEGYVLVETGEIAVDTGLLITIMN